MLGKEDELEIQPKGGVSVGGRRGMDSGTSNLG